MRPIIFECEKTIALPASAICAKIADLDNWREFNGYWVLPGIESAVFESRTENMIGSRIRVVNSDGSSHVEEIIRWNDELGIEIKLHSFSAPLDRFSTHFVEEWSFDSLDTKTTIVKRSFKLFPKSGFTRPIIWIISVLFKRAIILHFDKMAAQTI